MEQLKVYQIGLGSFGRYGFEKLIEMDKYLEKVDVRLAGVCDKDFEKLENAKKFASANNVEVRTFTKIEDLYSAAAEEEKPVMIYDAGPSETHSDHIFRSLQNGFFHLTEKPPSMTRDEHLKEKKLAESSEVFYKVDFIERENPVVKKALELVEGGDIKSIEVFRESSAGVQKILEPARRRGVKGGDILDKMIHEVYVLDLLEAAGKEGMDLENARAEYFMPKNLGSEKLMGIGGEPVKEIDDRTATGHTSAVFTSGEAEVKLHSGWLGLGRETRERVRELESVTSEPLVSESYKETGDNAFLDQETRFFVIEGGRYLLGDMLHNRLYDLEEGSLVELPELVHDQLYRVIKKAIYSAAGIETDAEVTEKETEKFVSAIFDIRDSVIENASGFLEERDRANDRVDSMIVKNVEIEEEESVKA